MICHRLHSGHYGAAHLRMGTVMTMMMMMTMIMVITIVMMMMMVVMFLTSLMYRGGRRNP